MKYLKITILLLIQFHFIYSQDDSNPSLKIPIPTAPGTTAFDQYGKYPVNYFTGVPDISIPLYTIQS